MLFGLITDLWGDAPYTNALKGEQDGVENIAPKYDEYYFHKMKKASKQVE